MIGITGASGHLGLAVAQRLLEVVPPAELAFLTRTPDRLSALTRGGASARLADFDRPDLLEASFAGLDRLLLIPTNDLRSGARRRQHEAAVRAAVKARVRRVVYLSAVGARPGTPILEDHFRTELALLTSPLTWTVIRMNLYADTLLPGVTEAVKTGVYSAPESEPVAYVARGDVAEASAAALRGSGHEGRTYFVCGPRALAPAQVAAAAAEAAGRPIELRLLAEQDHRDALSSAGLPAEAVEALLGLQAAAREGAFDVESGDARRLCGRPPEPLPAFLKRSLEALLKVTPP